MGAGPRAKAQPLGFSDAAGTDPSTDAVPVLNHEAVVGGFATAYDVHGYESPGRQVIIIKQLMERVKPVLIDAKNDTCHMDGPTWLGDNAARGAPPTEQTKKCHLAPLLKKC